MGPLALDAGVAAVYDIIYGTDGTATIHFCSYTKGLIMFSKHLHTMYPATWDNYDFEVNIN